MADSYTTKKIADLTEKTTADDTDLYILGNAGTSTMRKITFATLAAKIRDKLTSLTFSTFGTTAKTIPGAVNELNSGKVSNIDSAIISNGTVIPANADLDDYTTFGVYYSTSAARSETLSNTPVTNAGYKLIVAQTGYTGTNCLVQIAILGASTFQTIYMRNSTTSAGWSDWRCLTQGDMRSAFIYASTYAELYSLCMSMQTSRTATISLTAAAANAISNNTIGGTFKGIITKTNATTFDILGMAGAGSTVYTGRITMAASGATVNNLYSFVIGTPLFKRGQYTLTNVTIPAGGTHQVTANDVGLTVPSGYIGIGFEQLQVSANASIGWMNARASGDSVLFTIKNTLSSSMTVSTAYIKVTFARADLF